MRKNIITIIALLSLCSCLDEDPRSQLYEREAFATASDLYNNTVANLYNFIGGSADSQGLQGTSRGVWDLCELTTDEAIIPTRGGDWFDGGLWQSLYLHQYNPGTQPIEGTWDYLYKVIVMCNQALAQLDEHSGLLNEQTLAQYKAEVRTLRSLYYVYLIDLFGQVPYLDTAATLLKETNQISRSELFENIWNKITEALPLLPDARSNQEGEYYGRITRHVAWFILAKMALNAEVWTYDDWTDEYRVPGDEILFNCEGHTLNAWETCLYWCNKFVEAGYNLEDEYATNFSVNNEISRENIFTIPMNKFLYANTFNNLFRSRHYNHGMALGMDAENGISATVNAVRTYGYGTRDEDTRYVLNFFSDTVYVDGKTVLLDNGLPLVYMPLEVELDLSGSRYEKTAGARMKKYEIDRRAYSDGLLQSNDIVLFRYADVVLMMAEAKVRNGWNGDAELNYVRQRVGMAPREATLDNILDERLMELQWEGWRRQDLIRFDRFHRAYDERPQLKGEADRHTTVFPIPGRAITLNGQIKQNPEY